MSSVEISFCLTLFFFAHGSLWSLSASTGCNSLSVKLQNSYVGWEVLTRADARSRRNTKLIFSFYLLCHVSVSSFEGWPSQTEEFCLESTQSSCPRRGEAEWKSTARPRYQTNPQSIQRARSPSKLRKRWKANEVASQRWVDKEERRLPGRASRPDWNDVIQFSEICHDSFQPFMLYTIFISEVKMETNS